MLGLSTADGFLSVKEGVDDMIKYLANEPSVGLFFVQQHAHASMPYLLDAKEKVMEKIHEVTLHTEDVEDSIEVVRSMTEVGYPLCEEMIKDIKECLLIISNCQPKKGLIKTQTIVATSVGSSKRSGQQKNGGSQGYLSSVLSSAKQRATDFRTALINQPLAPNTSTEAEKLPLSSSVENDEMPSNTFHSYGSHECQISTPLEDFSKFKFDKEAKFEVWLQQESEEQCKLHNSGD